MGNLHLVTGYGGTPHVASSDHGSLYEGLIRGGQFVMEAGANFAASVVTKIKQLDNASIFFDVPLYVGLFGTVSAFLVMTFSPQSSRLIAYSSTLIGIVFSILLKLTMEYPFRQQLLRQEEENKEGAVK